jgi:hypothetical protein
MVEAPNSCEIFFPERCLQCSSPSLRLLVLFYLCQNPPSQTDVSAVLWGYLKVGSANVRMNLFLSNYSAEQMNIYIVI